MVGSPAPTAFTTERFLRVLAGETTGRCRRTATASP